MSSMQKMIERINARLAVLESESRDRPGWLTRLMLSSTLPLEGQESGNPQHYAPEGRDADPASTASFSDS
jgi:hypothetical protein